MSETSKNKRKFRSKDNNDLIEGYLYALQISDKIQKSLTEEESVEDLADSMVPTNILLLLAEGYKYAFEALAEEELIQRGYAKADPSKLH